MIGHINLYHLIIKQANELTMLLILIIKAILN